jgi:hypothetical protein
MIFIRPGSSVKLIWSRMTLSSNASETRSKVMTGVVSSRRSLAGPPASARSVRDGVGIVGSCGCRPGLQPG